MRTKTINLAYPEKSDVKFKISKFPDGQQDIVLDVTSCGWKVMGEDLLPVAPYIMIVSRFNNFSDLELILCAVRAYKNLKHDAEISLFVPYILGARSDRKFQEGGTRYLRDIISPIINAQNFANVFVTDPHSDVMENVIDNLRVSNNLELVRWVFEQFRTKSYSDFVLVAPDAGAYKKIFPLAKQLGFTGDIVTCSKFRDVNGNIVGTNVPLTKEMVCKEFMIIDDICDGGATFVGIAEAIEKFRSDYKCINGGIHLTVTHGIFSKGIVPLEPHFDSIFCTNSIRDIQDFGYSRSTEKTYGLVKQYNVFK